MSLSKILDGRAPHQVPLASVRALHDLVVAGRFDPSELTNASLRPVVAESWRRSLAKGVNPDLDGGPSSAVTLSEARSRDAHPLARALPVIRHLLIDDARDAGVVIAIAAADGTLLWVEGDPRACRKAEAMNFVPGTDWSERAAGTNAPGTALALGRELQIRSSEHFSRVAQAWNCTAVPVHDPITGVLLGVIDVTGSGKAASSTTLALVRASVVAVENHLGVLHFTARRRAAPADLPPARLTVLGDGPPTWQVTDEFGNVHTTHLSPRHADTLVLLTRHPEGLTADHLAFLLDDKDLDVGTARAEMSRVRKAVGPRFIGSKPYRLLLPVISDIDLVLDELKVGRVAEALDHYRGELLPQSTSPAIARLRIELSAGMRGAVLASGESELIRRWRALPEGVATAAF